MNKKLIRLTESDLHKIVKESVEKILRESGYEYGKTIAHLPSADTPLSSKPKDAIYKIAREYIDFRNKNPKLVQTILKPSNYYDDGNYDEFKNDNEKLRRIFGLTSKSLCLSVDH